MFNTFFNVIFDGVDRVLMNGTKAVWVTRDPSVREQSECPQLNYIRIHGGDDDRHLYVSIDRGSLSVVASLPAYV